MRPLYKGLADRALQLGSGNAGLWYDKFVDRWPADFKWSLSGDEGRKLEWIETVARGEPIGPKQLIEELAARTLRLALARGGVFGIFVTESRFVTGLGRSHPVENGFAWHPALGVPYLPGSSVKGMVGAWAREASAARVAELLGSKEGSGQVVFLDAIPVAQVRLEADVLTPHYAGWDLDHPPGDWRSPTPVPFLVTAPETAFAFSILPARGAHRPALDEAFGWLRAALQDAGAGAKTSVGYGRFRYDQPWTEAQLKEINREREARTEAARRAEALRTPEGRWSLEIEGKKEEEILEMVRVHLEKNQLPDPADRRGFARAVDTTGLPALWRKGDASDPRTKVGKDKLKARARLVFAELDRD